MANPNVNWNELLSGKVEDAKMPDPIPVGTYVAIVKNREFKTSDKKGTPFVRYNCALISPEADVDLAQLQTYGGMEKLSQKLIPIDMYMTEDSRWRHKDFLEKCFGINISMGWQEAMMQTDNQQLKVHVAHRFPPPESMKPGEVPRPFAFIDDQTKA